MTVWRFGAPRPTGSRNHSSNRRPTGSSGHRMSVTVAGSVCGWTCPSTGTRSPPSSARRTAGSMRLARADLRDQDRLEVLAVIAVEVDPAGDPRDDPVRGVLPERPAVAAPVG